MLFTVCYRQILEALSYLHSLNIMHRDVKAENFMFESADEDAPLILLDFGISLVVPPSALVTNASVDSALFSLNTGTNSPVLTVASIFSRIILILKQSSALIAASTHCIYHACGNRCTSCYYKNNVDLCNSVIYSSLHSCIRSTNILYINTLWVIDCKKPPSVV